MAISLGIYPTFSDKPISPWKKRSTIGIGGPRFSDRRLPVENWEIIRDGRTMAPGFCVEIQWRYRHMYLHTIAIYYDMQCIYIHTYVYIYMSIYVYIYIYVYICLYIYVYICLYIYIYIYYIILCNRIIINIYIYTYAHTHTHPKFREWCTYDVVKHRWFPPSFPAIKTG